MSGQKVVQIALFILMGAQFLGFGVQFLRKKGRHWEMWKQKISDDEKMGRFAKTGGTMESLMGVMAIAAGVLRIFSDEPISFMILAFGAIALMIATLIVSKKMTGVIIM